MSDKKMIECGLFYLCDPDKNTECSKTTCHCNINKDGCIATSKIEFAKLDEDGNSTIISIISKEYGRFDKPSSLY